MPRRLLSAIVGVALGLQGAAANAQSLVFYDPPTGQGELYSVASGTISRLQPFEGWRHTWS